MDKRVDYVLDDCSQTIFSFCSYKYNLQIQAQRWAPEVSNGNAKENLSWYKSTFAETGLNGVRTGTLAMGTRLLIDRRNFHLDPGTHQQ